MSTIETLRPTPEGLEVAAEALRAGRLVGMPTETVYGLAGDALNESALAAIFAAKERPTFDPLIVHVAPPAGLPVLDLLVDFTRLSPDAVARVRLLIEKFWPGPLTLVLPKLPRVPDLATSGLDTVAVRMPAHPVAQELIRRAGRPLAAPSANRFGRISPTSAAHVASELGDRVPYVVDGGASAIGVESTVVAVATNGALTLLRPGGAAAEEIERVAGVKLGRPAPVVTKGGMAAPGMLESHYAPRKPLRLLSGPVSEMTDAEIARELGAGSGAVGLLLMSGDPERAAAQVEGVLHRPVHARTLSHSGDRGEAARHLFAEMRHLDGATPAETIYAEPCTDTTGLGFAISDRLRRASAPR